MRPISRPIQQAHLFPFHDKIHSFKYQRAALPLFGIYCFFSQLNEQKFYAKYMLYNMFYTYWGINFYNYLCQDYALLHLCDSIH